MPGPTAARGGAGTPGGGARGSRASRPPPCRHRPHCPSGLPHPFLPAEARSAECRSRGRPRVCPSGAQCVHLPPRGWVRILVSILPRSPPDPGRPGPPVRGSGPGAGPRVMGGGGDRCAAGVGAAGDRTRPPAPWPGPGRPSRRPHKAPPPARNFCAAAVSSLTLQRQRQPQEVAGPPRPGGSGKRICPRPDPRGHPPGRPPLRPRRSPAARLLGGFPPGELRREAARFASDSAEAAGLRGALPRSVPPSRQGRSRRAPQTPGPRPARASRRLHPAGPGPTAAGTCRAPDASGWRPRAPGGVPTAQPRAPGSTHRPALRTTLWRPAAARSGFIHPLPGPPPPGRRPPRAPAPPMAAPRGPGRLPLQGQRLQRAGGRSGGRGGARARRRGGGGPGRGGDTSPLPGGTDWQASALGAERGRPRVCRRPSRCGNPGGSWGTDAGRGRPLPGPRGDSMSDRLAR